MLADTGGTKSWSGRSGHAKGDGKHDGSGEELAADG